VIALSGAAVAAVFAHDVSTALTPDDETYIMRILSRAGFDPNQTRAAARASFEAEVQTIVQVQAAVLAAAPENRGIPLGSKREPRDLFEHKYGLCYDRSRVIEKILSWLRFKTRHVSIYATTGRPRIVALLTPQGASHAVSEVQTQKGWMVVDSNVRWIGLDVKRSPVSLNDLQHSALRTWAHEASDPIDEILTKPFIQIRGLYSRHGQFYPPFNSVPDFNLLELVGNVTD
jgi:hypothetical protein